MGRRSNYALLGRRKSHSGRTRKRGQNWWGCSPVSRPVPRTSPCSARERQVVTEYAVIDEFSRFEAACRTLAAGTGPVAVDVERASGFRYSQRAYLVQVFRRDAGVFLFDP
ncbi:MAG: hypothetical protein ACTHZW_02895, partial [Microbacteriaceae bacterium]